MSASSDNVVNSLFEHGVASRQRPNATRIMPLCSQLPSQHVCRNRVAKGFIKSEGNARVPSDTHGKAVMWIDLIGGEGIRFVLLA